jgi:hypothetical protein
VAARWPRPEQAHGGPIRLAAAGRVRAVQCRGDLGLTVQLERAHDIAPFWDALTTAISLAAQFLLNCKRIENWTFWIAADIIYIPLYVVKLLDLTAIVYVLFLAIGSGRPHAGRRDRGDGGMTTPFPLRFVGREVLRAAPRRPRPASRNRRWLEWTHSGVDAVAAEQTRREEEAAAAGSPLVVCDAFAGAAAWRRASRRGARTGTGPGRTRCSRCRPESC